MDKKIRAALLRFQRSEITEYYVYSRLSRLAHGNNRAVIKKIANEEKEHYELLKNYTKQDVAPSRRLMFKYALLSKILGVTFTVKLMERGERMAQTAYRETQGAVPPLRVLMADEHRHEQELIKVIQEERLDYMGSVVLGLNDALVQLTGALAGLSFALQNTKLIALAGLVTGIAASFSMAASEYLSSKAEGDKNPGKSSVYTFVAYIFTVAFLVFPFLILPDYRWSLLWTMANAVVVIATFTYFNAVTKELSFKKLFSEMFLISMGVAALSFVISVVLKKAFGIET